MTYFEAVGIQQDLIVNMQYAYNQTAGESLKEAAAKYTDTQYTQALSAIKKHYRKEYEDTKELFMLAMASKKIKTGGKKNGA